MTFSKAITILVLPLALTLSACGGGKGGGSVPGDSRLSEQQDFDRQLTVEMQINPDSVLEVIDFLQTVGRLSPPVADYERGTCYALMEKRRIAEYYAMKFTRPAGDGNSLTDESQTDESPEKKEKVRLIVGASDGFATFTVEDTGCGVPSGEAEHIFEEFVQLNEFYEGTGIGLSVARSIARRLGGDITLDTTYFHGARFVMTLAI